MLWKSIRIHSWNFQTIIRKGTKTINSSFLIYSHSNNSTKINNIKKILFGISVPKNIFKKSVERNKYKRQIRTMIMNYIKKKSKIYDTIKNLSIIIIASHKYPKKKYSENKIQLEGMIDYIIKKKHKNFTKR